MNKADIARNDAAQKSTDFAESLIPIVAENYLGSKKTAVSH